MMKTSANLTTLLAVTMLFISSIISSQTTSVSSTSLGGGNGSSAITFNISTSSTIRVKDIKCMFSGTGPSQLWYNPTAINGTPTITSAAGWILLGTVTPTSTGLQSLIPINLTMTAGSSYGFYISASNIVYTGSGSGTPSFSPTSFTDGILTIDVGVNVGYGGSTFSSHVRGFNGEVGYEFIPEGANDATTTDTYVKNGCPGVDSIFAEIANYGSNQIDSVWVNWSKNGIIQTPIHYVGLLDTFSGMGSKSAIVPLGTNTFLIGVTDTFDVWTSLPNGITDTVSHNDTNTVYLKPSFSGTFTIGGVSPDYTSFSAAVADLYANQVCGPITFNVRQGTYNEQIEFSTLSGSSSVNTILFQSDPANTAPVNLTYGASSSSDNYVLKFNDTKYITFDSITITATGATYGYAVHLKKANHVTIKNCEINASSSTSVATSVPVYNEPGLNVENCTIENNKIKYGRYGLFWEGGSSSSREAGNVILNNEITNFNSYGLWSYYQTGIQVEGNIFNQIKTTSSDTWGIYSHYNYSPLITRNKIELTSTGDNIGIYIFNNYGTSSNKAKCYNNMIVTAVTTSGSNNGIYVRFGKHINIYHNSVHCRGGNSFDSKALKIYALSSSSWGIVKVRNNILVNSGVGDAYYISSFASSTGFVSQQDYNIYQSTTTTPLSLAGVTHSLTSWQTTTSFDANSYNIVPGFISATDLHIQDTTAADKGTNVGVMIDIDGDTRPLLPSTGYDIGADEYIPPTCPMGAGLVTFNPTSVGTDVTWTKGTNDTSWIFEYGTPGFTPGTGTSLFSTNDTATITGLNPISNYCVYVRGICGTGDTSLYVGPICFRTRCVTSLSGVYTINNTMPTAGTNYNSFADVMNALNSCGISGPTIFHVKQGTYNDQIDIGAIVGSSATNTITFKADPSNTASALLTYSSTSSANNFVVKFSGANNIIFDDLTISATGNSFAYGFNFINADFITIKNCNINCTVNRSSGSSPIYNSAGTTNVSNNCTIENNKLKNGYYGLYWYGRTSPTKETGNKILNNTVLGFYIYGVNFHYQDNGRVENNIIQQMPAGPTSSYGLSVRQSDSIKIKSNKIILTGSGSNYGLFIDKNIGSPSNKVEIYNNMISTSVSSSGNSYGVYIGYGKHINLYHNSVNVQGGSITTGRGLYLIGDSSSVYGNVNIRNNVFSNSGPGVAMYINSGAASTFLDEMDNNIYVASSGDLISFNGTIHNTLTSYITSSGLDLNSLSGSPGFTSGTDLHLLGAIAYDNGDPTVGIMNDIDGDTRPLAPSTGWDIGADEYIPPTCPSPYSIVNYGKTSSTLDLTWTQGPADNSWEIQYGPTGFSIGRGVTVSSVNDSITLTGLMTADCYDIWVRSVCSVGDTSIWNGPYKYCTNCGPFTDYCSDFESDYVGEVPLCWTKFIYTTSSTPLNVSIQTTAGTSYSHSGNKSVRFDNHDDARAIMILSTPKLANLGSGTHRANFWMKGDSSAIIGTMTDPNNSSTFTPFDTLNLDNSTYKNFRISFSSYSGADTYLSILFEPNVTFDNIVLDDFCWEAIPSCEKTPSVTILNSGVNSNFLNVGWNIDTTWQSDSLKYHKKYMIVYGPRGFTPGDITVIDTVYTSTTSLPATPNNFLTVNGLNPLSEYCFWVKSICENGDSSIWTGPHCGKTACAASVPLTYFEDFTSYIPQCWEEAQGKLGLTNTTFTSTSSGWEEDQFGNTSTNMSAKMNIWSNGVDEWLISPTINLGTISTQHIFIEYDIALTSFSSTSSNVFGSDDTVALVISRDNGLTWSKSNIIALYNTGNTPSNTGDHIQIDLPYETGLVKFGFYAASSISNEDMDIFIDNFKVFDSVPASLEEITLTNQFKVFPNPNNGLFTIRNIGNTKNSNIKILDIQGRLVYEQNYIFSRNGSKQVNLTNLQAGVYILLVQSNGTQEQHRIIIE